jgi:hypothetical protein
MVLHAPSFGTNRYWVSSGISQRTALFGHGICFRPRRVDGEVNFHMLPIYCVQLLLSGLTEQMPAGVFTGGGDIQVPKRRVFWSVLDARHSPHTW